MAFHPQGILFDLDGTLLDHFNVLYRCYEHTLEHLGLAVPDFKTIRRTVGGSMEVTMGHFVGPEQMEEAVALWRRHFDAIFLEDVTMLPGCHALVEELHRRGAHQAIFTNKIGNQSRRICTHLGLDPMIEFVLGANDTPFRKPQPEFSRAVLERMPVPAAETIFIGDSPFDIEAARCVSRPAYCVTTGTHTREELEAAGADGVFTDMSELARAVFSIELEPAGRAG